MNILESAIYSARIFRSRQAIDKFTKETEEQAAKGPVLVDAAIYREPAGLLDTPGDFDRDEIHLQLTARRPLGNGEMATSTTGDRLFRVRQRQTGKVIGALIKGEPLPDNWVGAISGIDDAMQNEHNLSLLRDQLEQLLFLGNPNVKINVRRVDSQGENTSFINI